MKKFIEEKIGNYFPILLIPNPIIDATVAVISWFIPIDRFKAVNIGVGIFIIKANPLKKRYIIAAFTNIATIAVNI